MPGWSPHVGLGQPFLADPAFAAHYPGHALLLLLPPTGALAWLLALHLALAHAGAHRLARALGLGPGAAALAGVVYAGGGVAQSHVHGPCLLLGMAWLPWGVLGARWALAPGAPRGRLLVAAAPFALTYLAASPETAALAGALAWVLTVRVARAARVTGGLLVIAALAAALSASTLLPFLAVAGETDRAAGLGYAQAARWSLHPLELVGLVVPQPFAGGGLPPAEVGHVGRPWFLSLYVGAAPAALLALGALAARRDARARLLLVAAAPFLLYALGEHGPLHPLLFEHVPAVRSFRYPAKAFLPVALCAALLVGVGLERARARPLQAALALVAALALAAAAAAAWRGATPLAWRAAATAAVALAALVLWRARPRLALRGGLVLLTLLDLGLAARGVIEVAPAALYSAPPALLGHVAAAEGAAGAPLRVATLESAFTARGVAPGPGVGPEAAAQRGWREALLPNTAMSVGARTASGFSSFVPARQVALRAAAADVPMPRYLRLLGAGLVVHAADDATVAADAAPIGTLGPWVLSRLEAAPPWAAVHREVVAADDARAAVAAVTAPGFVPGRACVLEGAPPLVADPAPRPLGLATPRHLGDDLVVLEVDAGPGGVLVVREGWGRGWRAEVDGRPAPLLPADALFRGVPVPAGRHGVTLRYEAPLRGAGVAVGLAAWAALVVVVVAARRR
ncbi:MAG: YfhO family protein [Planctomycetes bacterium]|nr:YfhO family protein [Planctomycetota bacterium]